MSYLRSKVVSMKRIIECVPNFSEGRNRKVIDEIVKAIVGVSESRDATQLSAEGVGGYSNGRQCACKSEWMTDAGKLRLIGVDSGEAANRTVITFAGSPEAVCEAAFRGAEAASRLIDMRFHHGVHPRSGALDVLPLVPVEGVSLEECAEMARALAKRMYDELGIPVYCYEAAAFAPERRNLAVCRAGGYEALPDKMADPSRRPDFGPDSYNETVARTGASNVGARNFLIAVNFNLNTDSAEMAGEVAKDVREKGRKGPDGKWIPGTLKGCKAIGWYIEEYGKAQVSMNITDIDAVPLHTAFEEVSRAAAVRGLRVTGTEIVGLVPKRVLTDAGKFYLHKQQSNLWGRALVDDLEHGISSVKTLTDAEVLISDSMLDVVSETANEAATGVVSATANATAAGLVSEIANVAVPEEELIETAVRAMGLDELRPFNPHEKVIEYLLDSML